MDQLKRMRDYREARPTIPTYESAATDGNRPVLWSFLSGKGGVGKSILSGIIALQLSRMGYKTLFVDMDFSLPGAHLQFNLDNFIDPEVVLAQAAMESDFMASEIANLDVFVMQPQSEPANAKAIHCLDSILQNMASAYDFILLDATTGFGEQHRRFSRRIDLATVVSTPDPASITNAYALIKMIKMHFPHLHVNIAMNRAQSLEEASDGFGKLNLIVEHFLRFNAPLLCSLNEEKKIKEMLQESWPLQKWPQNLAVFQEAQHILEQLAPQLQPSPLMLLNSAKAIA